MLSINHLINTIMLSTVKSNIKLHHTILSVCLCVSATLILNIYSKQRQEILESDKEEICLLNLYTKTMPPPPPPQESTVFYIWVTTSDRTYFLSYADVV